tara:strand:- start:642 stop:1733 length:1092 start_codon:yes stop_codon:yes gene_type:complete
MKNKTVVLGMSGGVDSSVSALLLKKQGYNVVGFFIRSYPDTTSYLSQDCPFKPDRDFAIKVAKKLKIPFEGKDYREEYFSKVIKPMFRDYKKGLTPNPDVLCNKINKFPALFKKAKEIKADFIATGHYSRIKKTSKGLQLLRGKDKTKDQSYFLHELTQSDLKKIIFPLGSKKKAEVRQIAKRNKFPNWNKHGSTGICFIGKTDMKSLLKANIKSKQGRVLDPNNKVIGTHPGSFYFTIGERIGSKHGIIIDDKYRSKMPKKLYIAKKKGNSLIVAPENHKILKTKSVSITKFRKLNPKDKIPSKGLKARIRHLGQLIPGTLKKSKNKYSFTFSKPQEGVAPGQSIVLYKNQQLLAAGEIRTK